MQTRNAARALILTVVLAITVIPSYGNAAVMRASDWLGHVVMTRDGKELGTVRDFGIDEHSGNVVFVVVSVGSFLIENNLIAVAPDALVRSTTEDGVLLLDTDPTVLHDAKRFASDSHWPTSPDVIRTPGSSSLAAAPPASADAGEPKTAAPPATGTATIESRSKTAHLSANERYVKETDAPAPHVLPAAPEPAATAAGAPAAPAKTKLEPITKFDKLDKDGDGVLNRSEFAPVMSRTDSYSKIDTNADGVIERQEFDAYESAHGATD